MIVVHKIALKPNSEQQTYFRKACGVSRFAYNWGLAEWNKQYKLGEKPSQLKLRRQLNAIKREEYPWMLEVTKTACQHGIINLGDAFKRFFKKQAKYPKFKKKNIHDSFRADDGPKSKTADAVKIIDKKIQLPKIGWIRMCERLRFNGRILSTVVSRKVDRWYVSVSVQITPFKPISRDENQAVGIDLGVSTLLTLSDGTKIVGPKPRKCLMKRIKFLSHRLAKKKIGSNNRAKARKRLAKLHAKIHDIRQDALHKVTTSLVRKYSTIVIEDLHVSGMMKNRKLAGAISDMGFYEFKRQLEYKAAWYGSKIVKADRFFPSSKMCSNCKYVNPKVILGVSKWQCPECHTLHDRDINAAKNLLNLSTVSFTGSQACGDRSAGHTLCGETTVREAGILD